MMLSWTVQQQDSPQPPVQQRMLLPLNSPMVTSRVKEYRLDATKALKKKIACCDKPHINMVRHQNDNYVIELSTSSFEMNRSAISAILHLDPERPTRHLEYLADKDEAGNVIAETIKIKSWSVLNKGKLPALSNLIGACSVVVNLYRTTSKCLINGEHASDLAENLIQPLTDRIQHQVSRSEECPV